MSVILRGLLDGGEFGAVVEEFADQGALRFDGAALLDDEHGHQAVGDQEKNGQNGQPAVLFGSSGGRNRGSGRRRNRG